MEWQATQTISTQVGKNPIPNNNNFPRTLIHLWISGAPEQETPTQHPLSQQENLLEPRISLQLQKSNLVKRKEKGLTKKSFEKPNSDVKGNANILHTRRREPHFSITTTLQEHQNTCGSLVLLRPGCVHSSSTSPIICEMEPLDKAVYCKLQVSILISPATKPYVSYVNRWIRQCTANSK